MKLKRTRLNDGALYVVLDTHLALQHRRNIYALADISARYGTDIVQYRFSGISDACALRCARRLAGIIHKRKRLFIVNNRPDIARLSGADGAHLGESDIPTEDARVLLGNRSIIGRTVHSLRELNSHLSEDIDYFSAGAVFASKTKPLARRLKPKALQRMADVARAAQKPFFAIGGITEKKIGSLIKMGIKNIVIAHDIHTSNDAARKIKAYKQCLQKVS